MLQQGTKTNDASEGVGKNNSHAPPAISLPKGGGAIRGIGEKFSANPVTGTGSLSVPLLTSPSRSGFSPQLALSYDSGAGNGAFGVGWNLSLPAITRKTDKGLPRYNDSAASDIFLVSGAEDLVPVLQTDGHNWVPEDLEPRTVNLIPYHIQRYRPRIEGLFARIERWTNFQNGETHWRSITKENHTTLYGEDSNSRIADPANPMRVFSWLISAAYDDKGNAICYKYKPEDSSCVDLSQPQERNRTAASRSANRYLKRVQYGNRIPYAPNDMLARDDWLFELVFDYGEHDPDAPTPQEIPLWAIRLDPFSTYRAAFEVRSYRLCRRVLMFHHFQELGSTPYLVRATEMEYRSDAAASLLTSISQSGFIRQDATGRYNKQSAPPLEFSYTEAVIDPSIHIAEAKATENVPIGLDGSNYQWLDLDSEGLSGILTEQNGELLYKRNLGGAHFAPLEVVATRPAATDLRIGRQQIMDLAGDGQKYLAQFSDPVAGFFERARNKEWGLFTPFRSHPNIFWSDPNLRFIDLDGDGHADILITEDDVLLWYPSLAREGFGASELVRNGRDEEHVPVLVFADGTQSIYTADMSGDGLSDLVRIRNGEVCYWPNLGYGHFGAKVTMDGAPYFDYPESFDQKRVRLADIDGSGTTDILYLSKDKINFWLNQAGNSFSAPQTLANFPPYDNLSAVMVLDLLGNGTACIVWSSPLPDTSRMPLRYIDLMSGHKPHLLNVVKNNLGAETRLEYAASTKFYLQAAAAGNPWVTKLPFPVHVLERMEVYDHISETKFVTTYRYRHGYYDGQEREFRGFGFVEQRDTESYARYSGAGLFTELPRVAGQEFHLPPVVTKTWFHTGAYFEKETLETYYRENEYYRGDPAAVFLPDTLLPPIAMTARELQEACRSLKGSILRQEVYAEDESPQSEIPYSVSERSYEIRKIQPIGDNLHPVFFVHPREALDYHYERTSDNPRISHQITLDVDEFGNTTRAAAVAYGRQHVDPDPDLSAQAQQAQTRTLIAYTNAAFINKPGEQDWYRVGVPCEARTYEITLPSDGGIFTFSQIETAIQTAAELFYQESPTAAETQKRLIEHIRSLYLKNDLSGPLSLHDVESLALPYESYKLAFTPGLLAQVYHARVNEELLRDHGKYVHSEGDANWWIPSGQTLFETEHAPSNRNPFYLPIGAKDPFNNISLTTYDRYNLLVTRTVDPLGNVVQARNNYRMLAPEIMTDPNENRAAVRFDALGKVVATFVIGKAGMTEGDAFDETASEVSAFDDPTTRLEYELFNWLNHAQPNFVHAFAREQHGAANPRWQETYSYSDGSGHEVLKKIQAEPGSAPARNGDNTLLRDASGQLVWQDTAPQVRWIGTGRTVLDNKSNPVKQYEPFFDSSPRYNDEQELVEWGVTAILRYDPLGRLVRTDHPNGTFSRVEFDAWKQLTFDPNDTVRASRWYIERGSPDPTALEPSDSETRAAWLAAQHADTPIVVYLDSLGRTFLTLADNGAAGKFSTRLELDIEGNQRAVLDALHRVVMRYDYDMHGTKIHSLSMDAGERWMLNNVAGKPLQSWDSRNHTLRMTYDALQRPLEVYLKEGDSAEILTGRTVYGESLSVAQAAALNARGKVYQHYDSAGVVTNEAYDFKGNPLQSTRRLSVEYKQQLNWAAASALQAEVFRSSTTYDALNRPMTVTAPDSSIIRPFFNQANLLERVSANLRGAAGETIFVSDIDYDAKGQREALVYGNNAQTAYTYDPLTFRLTRLLTTRTSDGADLQDLHYTYDPVGNLTTIQDDAQQTVYFRNRRVEPSARYIYDALYRLISATGREHLGQNARGELNPPRPSNHDDALRTNLPQPGEGNAMGNYTERYSYDAVGNILSMIHEAGAAGSWTRGYTYDGPSLHPINNRLTATTVGSTTEPYAYDPHGNMLNMPHLSLMRWDYRDQLEATSQQVVTDGTPEITYYVYDANGQRVRKVTERQAAPNITSTRLKERIYLGGLEIYREYENDGDTITLERETLHITDDKRRIALVETKTVDITVVPFRPTTLVRYRFSNHLGSASLELDADAQVISYEEYYPYGSTSYQAVRGGVEVSRKRYRYTGKERDEETGFYYHGARYYVPWLVRWVSADPIGIRDGVNVYLFVHGNPIREVDRTGFQGEPSFLENLLVFNYGSSEHDMEAVLPPVHMDNIFLGNLANAGVLLHNITTLGTNSISRLMAAPETLLRAGGASESDVYAYRFVTLMAGIGEFNAAVRMAAAYRAEISTARSAIQRARDLRAEIQQARSATLEAQGVARPPTRLQAPRAPAPRVRPPQTEPSVSPRSQPHPDVAIDPDATPPRGLRTSSGVVPGVAYPGYRPGMFGPSDLVLGTYPGGNLRATLNIAGGHLVTDIPLAAGEVYANVNELSIAMIQRALTEGRQIRFALDRLENIPGVVAGRAHQGAVTSAELRYIAQNWEQFRNNVTFWRAGVQEARPW